MANILVYYAHPAQHHSRANAVMAEKARALTGITFVDLYAEYHRYDIDVDREQERLLAHDVYVFQCPFFWYSTPSLVKEWIDLVLEHGFAYGHGDHRLEGKKWMMAITAAGPQDAYTNKGYQHYPVRTFLTPLEQTARLCRMEFLTPYVLYGSIKARSDGRIEGHADGYERLLIALRNDTYDFKAASKKDILTADSLDFIKDAEGQ